MSTWESSVRKVVPYTPGEQPSFADMIKLNTNENPYPPAPGVISALARFDAEKLRLYPDPSSRCLIDAIAKYHGVSPDQVFVGVGSDDVIAMSFLTFFNSGKPILFPDISYSFYDVWAELFHIPYETPRLDEQFQIREEDYYRENGGIIFPNPNAPTGLEMGQDAVIRIIEHNPGSVVIVDEAYVDFGAVTALPLINRFENLLVVRTFSKSRSMAGMRIGYAIGSSRLIRYLNDVKYSFNSYTMDRTALVTGTAAIEDEAYFRETCNKIIQTREWSKKELTRLHFHYPDSKANFIFAAHEQVPAEQIFQALREKHIFVRYFPKDRIRHYLRITIGKREDMEALFSFLESFLSR